MLRLLHVLIMILDDTPRYARVTYVDLNGHYRKFTGMVRRQDDTLVGSYKVDDPKVEDGYVLHMLYADVKDIVKVERQNPVYETWETTEWQS